MGDAPVEPLPGDQPAPPPAPAMVEAPPGEVCTAGPVPLPAALPPLDAATALAGPGAPPRLRLAARIPGPSACACRCA